MAEDDTLKDLRSDCKCSELPYCPYEALFRDKPDRLFRQHKCVEILKWNRQLPDGDAGWKKAYGIWFNEGYAGAFAQVYDSKLGHRQLFDAIEAEIVKAGGAYAAEAARLTERAEVAADMRLNKTPPNPEVRSTPPTQGLEVKAG